MLAELGLDRDHGDDHLRRLSHLLGRWLQPQMLTSASNG